ncbi:hypothetical protein BDZ97DRAFT_1813985, partial [Flammula alnicola]
MSTLLTSFVTHALVFPSSLRATLSDIGPSINNSEFERRVRVNRREKGRVELEVHNHDCSLLAPRTFDFQHDPPPSSRVDGRGTEREGMPVWTKLDSSNHECE